jgi:hypothetical protein
MRARHSRFSGEAMRDDLLVLTMAGPIAESALLGRPVWIGGADRKDVQDDMVGAVFRRRTFHRRARKLVRENWDAIIAVADEPCRVGRISGKRLDQIIASCCCSVSTGG